MLINKTPLCYPVWWEGNIEAGLLRKCELVDSSFCYVSDPAALYPTSVQFAGSGSPWSTDSAVPVRRVVGRSGGRHLKLCGGRESKWSF
jgi:hypothetical protein